MKTNVNTWLPEIIHHFLTGFILFFSQVDFLQLDSVSLQDIRIQNSNAHNPSSSLISFYGGTL